MWADQPPPTLTDRLRAMGGLLGFVAAAWTLLWLAFALVDWRQASSRDGQLTVGSKKFTESVLLAEITAQLIERDLGVSVVRRTNLGGTEVCFEALKRGDLDLYVEYTGTGLTAILGKPPQSDPQRVLSIVRKEFRKRHALVWLEPLGFNNTYALAMTESRAAALSIQSISDLRPHRSLKAGFATEFLARKDGYPGLKQRYGLAFEPAPKGMEAGLMYSAVAAKEVDVISAYATDARIDKLGLRVLDDDQHAFPPYQAVPLVRADSLARHPQLLRTLTRLKGRIDDAEMRRLNGEIDVEKRSIAEVARRFVQRLPK